MLKKIDEFFYQEYEVKSEAIYGGAPATCYERRCGTSAGEFGDVSVYERDDDGWEDSYIIDLATGDRVEQ